jgi:hypothetical protein
VLPDVARLRRQAQASGDAFWELTAHLEEALILAELISADAVPSEQAALYLTQIRQALERAEAFGRPSGIAYGSMSLGLALRNSEPAAALALLEHSLDLCEPIGADIISSSVRLQLASHYTQLGRPLDALALIRPTISICLRTGAWHETWSALAQAAPPLADIGRHELAAIVLARLRADVPHFEEADYGLAGLKPRLRAEHGEAAVDRALATGARLSMARVVQLVTDAIDEVVV